MMKKLLLFVVCFGSLSGLYLNAQKVRADTSHSKITGTLIESTTSSSNKKSPSTQSPKTETLPKTGEISSSALMIAGISVILLSGIIWYSRKKAMDEYG